MRFRPSFEVCEQRLPLSGDTGIVLAIIPVPGATMAAPRPAELDEWATGTGGGSTWGPEEVTPMSPSTGYFDVPASQGGGAAAFNGAPM